MYWVAADVEIPPSKDVFTLTHVELAGLWFLTQDASILRRTSRV
jgi:hypothetical protein